MRSATTRALLLCAGTALLSACATRPVTEGVTGVRSYFIAQAVRCEIRDAIIALIAGGVRRQDPDWAARLARRDSRDGAEAEEVQRFRSFLASDYKNVRNSDVRSTIERYTSTLVAYEFDFNITQTHEIGAGVDLLSTITRGTVTTGIGAGFKGQRNTQRNFKLIDQFADLLVSVPTIQECNNLRRNQSQTRTPNGAYPLAGSLNLREVIDTFLSLTQSTNLVGNFIDKRDVPTFAETMIFTTTVSAGLTPTLEMRPLGRGTEIKGADALFNVHRHDIHKLVLTMTLPPQGDLSVAQKRSIQAQVALDELERQRIRAIDAQTEDIRRRLSPF